MTEKLQNIAAEQMILGMILSKNDLLSRIRDINPEDFSEPLHQKIFQIMKVNYQNNDDINPITLKTHFLGDAALEDAGGYQYLFTLGHNASGSLNIQHYAREIKEFSNKRKIKDIFLQNVSKIDTLAKTSSEIMEDFNKDVAELQAGASEYRIMTYENVLTDIILDMKNIGKELITPTGLLKIDTTMNGGLHRGKSYCFAAKPKEGKTMLKGTIANNLRIKGVPFLFIAAEMSPTEIAKRIIGSELDMDSKDMNRGNDKYMNYLYEKAAKSNSNMFFVNAPRISLSALRSVIISAARTKKIEGVVLDYLQLVTGKGKNETIAEHQENVAQTIAELCKKENIWCLYSAQINRKDEVRNGDGILMAIDWLYEINRTTWANDSGPVERVWLKHIATRNHRAVDIGDKNNPYLELSRHGTHFFQIS